MQHPEDAAVQRAEDATLQRSVLPSGLRVVTEQLAGSRCAMVGMWVAVGSRDEPAAVAGAAHYLEHLLFKGTVRRSAAAIAEEIDAVGGELNAFTTREYTCYHAQVLDCDLGLAIDLVCDVLGDALLDPADVELERGVVLEEIAMRDDDPEDLVHDEFCAALFGSHPLGRPVLGTEESVTGMSRAALHHFYRQRYTPERMVLTVTGNVTHSAVLAAVAHSFGHHLTGCAQPARPRRGRAEVTDRRALALCPDSSEQAHLMLGVPALNRHDDRRYVLGVLNAALGGGMSSRLFQQVREQRGLAYSVYSAVECYADLGSLSIYAGCSPGRLGEVAVVVGAVLADLVRDGLSDTELVRGKGQLRGELVLGLEDAASWMTRIGIAELNHGAHCTVDDELRRIDAVTAEQVGELARELLRRPVTAAVVGPYADVPDLPDGIAGLIA
ncbi:MAG: M16 family metallopeptidase [Pseudonocardiaceae bacterium]